MSGDGKQTVFGVPRFIRRSDVAKLLRGLGADPNLMPRDGGLRIEDGAIRMRVFATDEQGRRFAAPGSSVPVTHDIAVPVIEEGLAEVCAGCGEVLRFTSFHEDAKWERPGWVHRVNASAYCPGTEGEPAEARPAAVPVRHCRHCGCTDGDCSGCIARTGVPCHWVSPNACSACEDRISALDNLNHVFTLAIEQELANMKLLRNWDSLDVGGQEKAADLYRRTLVEQIRGDLAAFGVSEEELNAHGITL